MIWVNVNIETLLSDISAENIAAVEAVLESPVALYEEDHVIESYRGRIKSGVVYRVDLDKLPQLSSALGPNGRIVIAGTSDEVQPLYEIHKQVLGLASKLDEALAKPENYVNNKVDVHVPGNSLVSIDEAKVLYDLCTDELNDWLSEGWRILAICPQPNQRRPDYVLGRRVKEES